MSLAGNIPTSISELAKLSDEIWYLAGDTSVDTAWYTKRASLSAIYASTGMCFLKFPFTLGCAVVSEGPATCALGVPCLPHYQL